jgi:NitT/TauT family transport system permease protein
VRIAAFYLALLGAWQLLYESERWPPYAFPSPSETWDAIEYNWDRGELQRALEVTMRRMAIGYALAILLGTVVGVMMGTLRWVDETVGSLVLGLQSLPSICWLPLALLWFGLNERAIIFVVLMGSVCSVAISSRTGVQTIPPLQLRAARMFGGRQWQQLVFVVVPAMLPSMVQGLKLGWSFAWRSLLAAEIIYSSSSLGHLLQVGRDLNLASQMIGIMLVIVAIGMLVDRVLFATMERWVNERWGLAR